MPPSARPIADRFWPKVVKGDGCWEWTGAHTIGYGCLNSGPPNKRTVYAHRVSYEIANGPVPDGLEVDHLCRNRGCVNPAHLEAVTHHENLLRGPRTRTRKALCVRGHPLVIRGGRQRCSQRYVCATSARRVSTD